ncbi:putative GTP-binding protein YjiA [Thalassovita gelatinovora]|uniref:Putative GTP-binding protein YjiA n=1 Tax=Thalassovita gelatinovora TaxID=53501 RepID=A0A0P1FHP9_THAGE|nr:GTP-binding protein [Thalassovita gelatinovora]QIZ82028.1 GTP-binding protein [Thalassovita gelatinovora]CUH67504.1 putative GTP-binding protein YjiA [Thalassovita gelatinovora]SEP72772.1 GTPase, G3E family [Thalassovita gelatinovora]
MTPVILLTGFLGSGKTTLLQRLLTDPSMQGAAVLINEFGEVGLDHHLLDRIDDNVVLLKSGCICCTVRGEVADALSNLDSMRTRGEIDFDRVVIETTGLADPYPVLQTLTAHPVLRSHFVNGGVLTTVDAVNAGFQVEHRAEAARQIAAADRIVLTKTDLADQADVAQLKRRLSKINPGAKIFTTHDPVGSLVAGFGAGDHVVPPAAAPQQHDHVCDAHCEHDHHHVHHHHDDQLGVISFSLIIDTEIDWTMFGTWLTLLLNRYGDRIFRVKGILALKGEDRPIAIHGVQHLVHAPTHMENWPEGPRQSRLVFILEGLSPDLIKRSFAAFTGLEKVRTAA